MERTLEVPLKIPESTSIYIYIRFDIVEKCMASVTCAHYRSPNHIEYCRARSICGLARGGYFLKSDISRASDIDPIVISSRNKKGPGTGAGMQHRGGAVQVLVLVKFTKPNGMHPGK